MTTTSDYDIEFFWDPVCPFAWITSRWIQMVQQQKDYTVDWRFISLRILNADKDYSEFPSEYETGHTNGQRMLRVAAAVRSDRGREPMGELYTAFGRTIFDREPPDDRAENAARRESWASRSHLEGVLGAVDLPLDFADAADDPTWDEILHEETEAALAHTGRDVGTPIITFHPPDGPSFFGPVISRIPDEADAVRLWDSVITLATFPGFAELKRSLREVPQLRVFGVEPDAGTDVATEDWKGGSRRAG